MKSRLVLLAILGATSACGRTATQDQTPQDTPARDKPAVAMIGTGTLAGTLGPALGAQGYRVIYGSRNPSRDSVRMLVERTGANASAVTQPEAAAQAHIVLLAVPGEVVEDVARSLGQLDGKIIIDVSGGVKRIAADGYLELVSDSTHAERIQSRHPRVRVVRINLPNMVLFMKPELLGTRVTVPIAGKDPRARETVANIMFDLGVDPWDAGPLRFSRVFDAMNTMNMIPMQQGRVEGYDISMRPSVSFACFFDVAAFFGFGKPYDLNELPKFPRREPVVACDEWMRRLGVQSAAAIITDCFHG